MAIVYFKVRQTVLVDCSLQIDGTDEEVRARIAEIEAAGEFPFGASWLDEEVLSNEACHLDRIGEEE